MNIDNYIVLQLFKLKFDAVIVICLVSNGVICCRLKLLNVRAGPISLYSHVTGKKTGEEQEKSVQHSQVATKVLGIFRVLLQSSLRANHEPGHVIYAL